MLTGTGLIIKLGLELMNTIKNEAKERLLHHFLEGGTMNGAERLGIVAKDTASSYFYKFQSEGHVFVCPCGNGLSHRGWCAFRFLKSPSRQAFIYRWVKHHRLYRPSIGVVWRPEPTVFLTTKSCSHRGCVFKIEEGESICGYHKTYFEHNASLVDTNIDPDDVINRRNAHLPYHKGCLTILSIHELQKQPYPAYKGRFHLLCKGFHYD